MFSVIKSITMASVPSDPAANYIEAACLSTDTKPTDGIANGSLCLELDTGDFYGFDADAGDWQQIGA